MIPKIIDFELLIFPAEVLKLDANKIASRMPAIALMAKCDKQASAIRMKSGLGRFCSAAEQRMRIVRGSGVPIVYDQNAVKDKVKMIMKTKLLAIDPKKFNARCAITSGVRSTRPTQSNRYVSGVAFAPDNLPSNGKSML